MRFTYERGDVKKPLETYEWDNVWWDHPADRESFRAVYIGDSISCGIRSVFQPEKKRIRLDGFGTSKAVDNPFFQDSLHNFAMQAPKPQAVLFNNGLHGWHLPEKQFQEHYTEMIRFLLLEYPCIPLIVISSTHVADPNREIMVKKRNEIAHQIAQKYHLPYGDLYSVSYENRAFLKEDGVHFQNEGYCKLADAIYGYLCTYAAAPAARQE